MKNWKTSLAGLAMILTAVVGIIQHLSDGTPIDINQHVAEIIAGVGFLAAKDYNVSGPRDSLTDRERGSEYGRRK